ncbi:MAG: hypothetical protein ABR607_06120 [Pyrinomonadaceae bacterium]
MQILNQLETEPIAIEEEEQRHTRGLLVGVLCALVLTGSVLGGYLYLRKRHERQVAAVAASEKIEKEKPKAEVVVDEAMIDGKKSVLGGTIHNISNETLHNVAVELQLRRRTGGAVETRIVLPQATDLAADARTRYSVEVSVQDYSSATFSRVLAGEAHLAIAFKALPGAERPPMPAPAGKTIVVSRPAPRGDEFLNTEKNPARVP